MKKINFDKKFILCLIIVIIILLGILVLLFSINKKMDKNKNNNSTNPTIDIEKKISEIGKSYYSGIYYPSITEPKELLSSFTEIGLSINLTNLQVTNEFDENLVKDLKNKKCNYDESRVIFYPNEPFGKEDYKLEVNLECNK